MRVSVQLAYKVPVLGPQDRHFLHTPRCPEVRPFLVLVRSGWAPTSHVHQSGTDWKGVSRGMSVRFGGNLLLRQRDGNVFEWPGGRGRKGFFLLDGPALLYGANLELGGGEDRA